MYVALKKCLDVIFQVRLQTMPLPGPGQAPMYTSAMDCVRKTIAKEGPKGLYKGKNPLLSMLSEAEGRSYACESSVGMSSTLPIFKIF